MKQQLFFYKILIFKNIFLKKVTSTQLPLNFLVRNYVDKNKNLLLIDNFSTFFNFKILKKKKLKTSNKKKSKVSWKKSKRLNLFNLIDYLILRKKFNTLTKTSSHLWNNLLRQTNKKYFDTVLTRKNRIETKKIFETRLWEQQRFLFLKKIQRNDIQKITSFSLLKKVKILLLNFLSEIEIKKIFDNKLLEKGQLKPILFLDDNNFKKLQETIELASSRIPEGVFIKHKTHNRKIVVSKKSTKFVKNVVVADKQLKKEYFFLKKKHTNSRFENQKIHLIKQNVVGGFISLKPIRFINKNNFYFSFNYYQKFFRFHKIEYLKTIITNIENLKNSSLNNKEIICSNKYVKGYTKAYLNGLLINLPSQSFKKSKGISKSQSSVQSSVWFPIGYKSTLLTLKLTPLKQVYLPTIKKIPFIFKTVPVTKLYVQTKKPKITELMEIFATEKKINENKLLSFKFYTISKRTFLKKKTNKTPPIIKKKKIIKKNK